MSRHTHFAAWRLAVILSAIALSGWAGPAWGEMLIDIRQDGTNSHNVTGVSVGGTVIMDVYAEISDGDSNPDRS